MKDAQIALQYGTNNIMYDTFIMSDSIEIEW